MTDPSHQMPPSSSLAERVAIVTGGGATPEQDELKIGAAIAMRLASAGAHVVVLDIDPEAGARAVEKITTSGAGATAITGAVSKRSDCDDAIRETHETYGRVDLLVNNAAVLGDARSIEADDDLFVRTMDINLMGDVRNSEPS